jgi:hypothetical protein
MADFDTKPCISENEQPPMIQPFAHVWNQIIGCEQAKAETAGNKFKEVQQANAEPMAGSFKTDVKCPIADIKIPDGWTNSRTERGGIGQRALDVFSSPDSSVSLSIFQEGLPLKDKAINALSDVLSKGNHQLLPNEIVAVRDAIGYSNAGDNQYTDKNYRPAFNLTAAGVQTVNDSQVLVVEGKYNNGGKMFKGVFAPFVDDEGKTRIQQVFMEGAPDQFPKYLGTYKQTIDSIQWKPETQKKVDGSGSKKDSNGQPPHNTGMIR